MAENTREITSNMVIFPDNKTLDEVIRELKKTIVTMDGKIKDMEGEGNER